MTTAVDSSTLPPTEKQVAYLRRLVERRDDRPDAFPNYVTLLQRADRWNRRSVSTIIDRLADDRTTPSYVAPNRYAGPCGACGDPVLAGEGRAERVGDRWSCYHADCETTDRVATPPVGFHYHAPSRRTVEVCVSKGGRLYYRVLSPERGWETDRTVEWGEQLDDRTTMTLDEARRIGAETGRCAVCGRELRRPESIREGIGPDCRARLVRSNATGE